MTRGIRLKWSSLRTRDTHIYRRAIRSGAFSTCFYDLGLSRLGFEHPTFRMRDKRSNRLYHRGGFKVISPVNEVQGVYRNHSVCPSVCLSVWFSVCLVLRLSVQIRIRPITFFSFDIGLPNLAHGCITIRRCVAYIHDPDTTLNFDLKVKFIGILTCFSVRPITFFLD